MDKKEKNIDNNENENDNDYEQDSGDSFGI